MDEKMRIMGEDEALILTIPSIVAQKIKPFLTDRDPLSEYLSICNLGAKSRHDDFLEEGEDECTEHRIDQCPEPCKVYKYRQCVKASRIKQFREVSATEGQPIQGKFTRTPFHFIIIHTTELYKCIHSIETNRIYIVFGVGFLIRDFSGIPLDELIDFIEANSTNEVVLCGDSMGGSLSLKCAERMAHRNRALFERCKVIAFAPFPCLDDTFLLQFKNVSVYFTAVQLNGHIYIDPFYYKNPDKTPFSPFTLLLWDETVTEVKMDDLRPVNEMKNGMMDDLFMPLHAMSSYILFFSLRGVKKRKQSAGKSRRSKTTNRPSRKVIVR